MNRVCIKEVIGRTTCTLEPPYKTTPRKRNAVSSLLEESGWEKPDGLFWPVRDSFCRSPTNTPNPADGGGDAEAAEDGEDDKQGNPIGVMQVEVLFIPTGIQGGDHEGSGAKEEGEEAELEASTGRMATNQQKE